MSFAGKSIKPTPPTPATPCETKPPKPPFLPPPALCSSALRRRSPTAARYPPSAVRPKPPNDRLWTCGEALLAADWPSLGHKVQLALFLGPHSIHPVFAADIDFWSSGDLRCKRKPSVQYKVSGRLLVDGSTWTLYLSENQH